MKTHLTSKIRRRLLGLAILPLVLLGGCVKLDVSTAPQAGGDGTGIQGIRRIAVQYDPSATGGLRGSLFGRSGQGNGLRGATGISEQMEYFYQEGTDGPLTPVAANLIELVDRTARNFYLITGLTGVFEQARIGADGKEVDPTTVTDPIVEACVFAGDPALGEPIYAAAYIAKNGEEFPGMVIAEFAGGELGQTSEEESNTQLATPDATAVEESVTHVFETGAVDVRFKVSGSTCELSGEIPVTSGGTVDLGNLSSDRFYTVSEDAESSTLEE